MRARSLAIAAPLGDADASGQSMDDASPAKWHLAHTSWFFETFVLSPSVAGYRCFAPGYEFLFNSYYEAAGPRLERWRRGMLTRPSLGEIAAYRRHVDDAVASALPGLAAGARALVELGLQHEEQHQELILTDVLSLFAANPLEPVYSESAPVPRAAASRPHRWIEHPGGIAAIGSSAGFAFDCETPRHDVLLQPFALGSRLVTNAEWTAFIDDGGYRTAALWLADGWAWIAREGVEAPLYWARGKGGGWTQFTLAGRKPLDPDGAVTHLSYYEADAFAAWAGARLPREAEWEVLAVHGAAEQMFGDCWQWTQSSYAPYPGFRAAAGAVGEYNGKFMCGQYVLRGSSWATPAGHSRPTYRNFFYPQQRWQFTGLRLAQDR